MAARYCRAKRAVPILLTGLLVTACAVEAAPPEAAEAEVVTELSQASAILGEADIAGAAEGWGTFYPYFTERTHALDPVLVGVAKIDAGQQIHPPHRHADEEYLMVTKGRGVWHLNGEERDAVEGDILFARPWDYHGIRAAEDSPLEFVVFKYGGRGIAAPTNPDPDLPEELEP